MSDRPSVARLASLRARLAAREVHGFFLPRTDEHGSEYLQPRSERVAWLTGFTGSAAQVLVLEDKAAVFSDGRYTVQLAEQVDPACFERCHSVELPPSLWLERNQREGLRLGYDPLLVRQGERDRLSAVLAGKGGTLVALEPDPLDEIWPDRPEAAIGRVRVHEQRFAGETSAAKRLRMGQLVAAKGAEQLVVTAADCIAWLLNVRGDDIPYNPLVLSHLLLATDGSCRWFVDRRKLDAGFVADNAVEIVPIESFGIELERLGRAQVRVMADQGEVHVGFLDKVTAAGGKLIAADNPIVLARAKKNAVEIEGARLAQRRDGAAVVRFLAWLDQEAAAGEVDEIGAAEQLRLERARDPLYRGDSFTTISAHGPNAALPHYRTTAATNRKLSPGTVYLVDSGGQYLDATTDITRTVALGDVAPEIRERFTLVLKGHIAIDTALFPAGTSGSQLDALARRPLWSLGLDFDHGTGHGIGSYLCVHEGPQRISKSGPSAALAPGMIISNEPGYYKAGAYGIRTENLLLVTERGTPSGGDRALLGFETLTLCPIDRRLIVQGLLDGDERAWVDRYHARVLAEIAPLLEDALARRWLGAACAPL